MTTPEELDAQEPALRQSLCRIAKNLFRVALYLMAMAAMSLATLMVLVGASGDMSWRQWVTGAVLWLIANEIGRE